MGGCQIASPTSGALNTLCSRGQTVLNCNFNGFSIHNTPTSCLEKKFDRESVKPIKIWSGQFRIIRPLEQMVFSAPLAGQPIWHGGDEERK